MTEFYVNVMPHLGGQVLRMSKFQQASIVLHAYKMFLKHVRIVCINFPLVKRVILNRLSFQLAHMKSKAIKNIWVHFLK